MNNNKKQHINGNFVNRNVMYLLPELQVYAGRGGEECLASILVVNTPVKDAGEE